MMFISREPCDFRFWITSIILKVRTLALTDALLADKAFDANWIMDEVNERGALTCISQRPQRKEPLEINEVMYGRRHLVENFFCNLKDFRRIALRSDKIDTGFPAMINPYPALINSR